jgi:hypothetical protein
MKTNTNIKAVFIILVLAVFCVSAIALTNAEALEPKLLWEKEFKYKHLSMDVAQETGDVIITSKDGREIILYDKNGHEIVHWGPRIDRLPFFAKISDDGKYFVFSSSLTEEYARKKGIPDYSDDRIHLFNRRGEEIWNKSSFGAPNISPDGSYIVIIEQDKFNISDMSAKTLFQYEEKGIGGVTGMSSDSSYFIITVELPGTDFGYKMTVFKKDGIKLWEKEYHHQSTSITDDATFIATQPYVDISNPENSSNGLIYDKNGKVVVEGYGFLSGNGQRVALLKDDRTNILSLPDKIFIKTLPIKAQFARFSHDGRYLVLYGKRINSTSVSNLFVYDSTEDKVWEINADVATFNFSSFLGAAIFMTTDGKHLIYRSRKKISYYQLY